MRLVSYPRSFFCVTRHAPVELSPKAQVRLRLLQARGRLCRGGVSWAEAARILGVSRASLYRWERRLEREGLRGLEERSRRPKRVRRPLWSEDLVGAVQRLREKYPRWGKETLAVLLKREGYPGSASTVGRILRQLKARGVLNEPPRGWVTVRKRRFRRPYAQRKPRGYAVEKAGDLVQVDTMDVRPLPGVVFKHFTARDMVSRWDVVQAHPRATGRAAAQFVDSLLARMPFRVRAIQVDGGSEFCGGFEQACARRKVQLFVLPPRSPKLNGRVERAHRTHAEEFYDLYTGPLNLSSINRHLRQWEAVYNTIRPHQSLDRRTPAEYLRRHHPGMARKLRLSHIC
jgi:transposase InsO family protein